MSCDLFALDPFILARILTFVSESREPTATYLLCAMRQTCWTARNLILAPQHRTPRELFEFAINSCEDCPWLCHLAISRGARVSIQDIFAAISRDNVGALGMVCGLVKYYDVAQHGPWLKTRADLVMSAVCMSEDCVVRGCLALACNEYIFTSASVTKLAQHHPQKLDEFVCALEKHHASFHRSSAFIGFAAAGNIKDCARFRESMNIGDLRNFDYEEAISCAMANDLSSIIEVLFDWASLDGLIIRAEQIVYCVIGSSYWKSAPTFMRCAIKHGCEMNHREFFASIIKQCPHSHIVREIREIYDEHRVLL